MYTGLLLLLPRVYILTMSYPLVWQTFSSRLWFAINGEGLLEGQMTSKPFDWNLSLSYLSVSSCVSSACTCLDWRSCRDCTGMDAHQCGIECDALVCSPTQTNL